MSPSRSSRLKTFRTLLILGRASNLPTVWSNCLVGWLLGGGGLDLKLLFVWVGATALYTGGMFLNDAFDADFDRQHRRERPIPTRAIELRAVWIWGFSWIALGLLLLGSLSVVTLLLTILLVASILLYDAIHKMITFSPVIMAACRFWLYLVAASASPDGVTGLAIWSAFALASYIVVLSYMARKESTRGPLPYWPCYLMAAPVLLALMANPGPFARPAIILSLVLTAWVLLSLRHALWMPQPHIGRAVSGLLAGIVLVDWLAFAIAPPAVGMLLALLFGAALVFQRFIPAT